MTGHIRLHVTGDIQLEFSPMIQNVKTARLLKFLGIHRDHGYTLNLPSGHSCPFASDCLSKADRVTGKITDGKEIKAGATSRNYADLITIKWYSLSTNHCQKMQRLSGHTLEATSLTIDTMKRGYKSHDLGLTCSSTYTQNHCHM